MKWYQLTEKKERDVNWILYRYIEDKPIELRERYRERMCPSCGKLDEHAAARSGIDDDVCIAGNADVAGADGFVCLSQRARQVVFENNVRGLDFVPLPCGRYFVAIPTFYVEVDVQKSGMQFFGQCMVCGRFEETAGGPGLAALGIEESPSSEMLRSYQRPPLYDVSLKIPDDPLQIFSPRVLSEGWMGRRTSLCMSEIVRHIFKSAKLTNAYFFELG